MNKKTLIFDFFGVICSEIAPFWLGRYFSTEDALDIKRNVVGLADSGKISQEDMFKDLAIRAGLTAKVVESDWNELVDIDRNLVKYIEDIRDSAVIGLLTNSPSGFVRGILKRFELEHLFQSIVVSSEIGIAKPDARAFEFILRNLSADPVSSAMIDDNPTNISGAECVGIHGILFNEFDGFKKQVSLFINNN